MPETTVDCGLRTYWRVVRNKRNNRLHRFVATEYEQQLERSPSKGSVRPRLPSHAEFGHDCSRIDAFALLQTCLLLMLTPRNVTLNRSIRQLA